MDNEILNVALPYVVTFGPLVFLLLFCAYIAMVLHDASRSKSLAELVARAGEGERAQAGDGGYIQGGDGGRMQAGDGGRD